MKKYFLILTCAGLFAAIAIQALASQPDLIAQIHFAGASRISADANSLAFTNEFCSAEARAFENQTLDKLSRTPYVWFKEKIAAGAGDGSAQLRPLLDDFLKSEWFFEIRATADGSQEFALAIRLNNDRAQFWQKNLQSVLESWMKLSAQKIPGGWELEKHQPPNLVRFENSGGWVVICCGQNKLPSSREIVQRASAENAKSWLAVDADWSRLERWFPVLKKFDLPETQLQVVGTNGNLQLNGKFTLAQPLPPLAQWRMPSNTIHQPFVSFTAARGFAPWLQRQDWARPYQISPMPNQIFIWSLVEVPFQTFYAIPVPDGKSAVWQLDQKMSFDMNWRNYFMSPVSLVMTNNGIMWRGVPFIAPFVQATHENSGDFLFGGFFPNTPFSKPLPQGLFTRLAEPNLVYYHWEITAKRLQQLQNLCQLGLMLTRHRQLASQSAGQKWISHIGPTLGNTVTEVFQTAPTELTFSRRAPGGLTAMELFAFASWLEATNFPGCDLRLPPRPANLKNRKPAAPPAKTP